MSWAWALAVLGGALWSVRRLGGAGWEFLVPPLLLAVHLPPLGLLGLSLLLDEYCWAAVADILLPVLILGSEEGVLFVLLGQPLLEPALASVLPALPPSLFGRHSAKGLLAAAGWGWAGRRLLRLVPGVGGLLHCALRWASIKPATRRFATLASLSADLRSTFPDTWATSWPGTRSARHLLVATAQVLRSRRLPVPLEPALDEALCCALLHLRHYGLHSRMGPGLSYIRLLRQPSAASPRLRRLIFIAGGGQPALEALRRAAVAVVRRPAEEAPETLEGALALLQSQGPLFQALQTAPPFGRKARARLRRRALAALLGTPLTRNLRWGLHSWTAPFACLPTEVRRAPGALAALVRRLRGGQLWAGEALLDWVSRSHLADSTWPALWPRAHAEPADEEKFVVACESEGLYSALVEGCGEALARAPPLVPDLLALLLRGPPAATLPPPFADLRSLLTLTRRFLASTGPRLAARRRVALVELRSSGLGALVADLRAAASAWPQTAFWEAELGELAAVLGGPSRAVPAHIAWPLGDEEAAERRFFAQRTPNVPLYAHWGLAQPLARPDCRRPTPRSHEDTAQTPDGN